MLPFDGKNMPAQNKRSIEVIPLEIQPITGTITHALSQRPEADNVHGARLMSSSPQAAKRKDQLDDSNSNSPPPLPKKRKMDKPAPAVKEQNTKTQKKSAKNEQATPAEAGASGASTSSSTAPARHPRPPKPI